MNPQSITITGRPFFKYRALMDAMLNKAIEKMEAAGVSEGTVMGQIGIKLNRRVDDITNEVEIRPKFVFNTTMSIPVKVSDKDEAEDDFIIFKDKNGRFTICDGQVSMDDILEDEQADDETAEDEPAEDEQDDADADPDDDEPAEDGQDVDDYDPDGTIPPLRSLK